MNHVGMPHSDRRYQSLLSSPWVWGGVLLSVVFWVFVGYLAWRWIFG
ncbi:hypothetical protein JI739_20290 [Ramlibacter sp. AW1]|uniref:Uncharacterized protein n=1 Tax=Ramlibacter aurantiacus TaxID=2801330 RepID=A0A936ZX23_9BURK|nr:hypothetical protein [Ramlibacter aurantiacus]MBL0422685.1 hypothetical protein [Ramlibacter aurantiacus]